MSDDTRRRWDRRYLSEDRSVDPSPFLTSLVDVLPDGGSALDVAGGNGRNALWLAGRGLDVTLVDFSAVALARAARAAGELGVPLDVLDRDLEVDPLPSGPWNLIVCIHYLQRNLFPAFIAELAPGGLLVMEIATVRNLERHERPPRAFLLDEGEALGLVAPLEVLSYEEEWTEHDRHEARVVARRS